MATELSSPAPSLPPPPPPRPLFTLRPRSGQVTSVQYTSLTDKEAILIGTANGTVSLWDLDSKREFWKHSREHGVISARPYPNSNPKQIISLHRQGSVAVWDLENEQMKHTVDIPDPSFCNFIILEEPLDYTSSTGPLIAVADREYGQVNIYDTVNGKCVLTLKAKQPETKGMVMCLCKGEGERGGGMVLCGCEDGSIMLLDSRVTKSEVNSIKVFSEPVMCMDYDSMRSHGLCGSPLNTLQTFTISEEQKCLEGKYSVSLKNNGVGCVSIRYDGRVMASGGWDGRIRVFGCKKGKPLAILDFHTDTVQTLSFSSPNASAQYSNLMICGSKDERVSLWKLY